MCQRRALSFDFCAWAFVYLDEVPPLTLSSLQGALLFPPQLRAASRPAPLRSCDWGGPHRQRDRTLAPPLRSRLKNDPRPPGLCHRARR